MRVNKKLIAGIVAFATTVTYTLYRRRGKGESEEAVEETDAPVA